MPETREQYEEMAQLFENALKRKDEENSKLRIEINKLKQKLEGYRREYAAQNS